MEKNKFLIIISGFVAIVLSSFVIFSSKNTVSAPIGSMGIVNSTVSVNLSTPQFVSAVSLRLTYDYSKEQKPDIQIQINKALTDNGWAFPINKVSVDDTKKIITIDVAAIIATPTGYQLSGTADIVTITSKKTNLNPSNFSIDKTETKVINKQGQEINLRFTQ